MIFPYWEEHRGNEKKYFPVVEVSVFGPRRIMEHQGLVDSGAEHSVFGIEVARDVGISLETEREVVVLGVGNSKTPGFLVPVELQLGRHKWAAPVIFSEAVGPQRGVLGHEGFFKFFRVIFDYPGLQMDIRRVRR